MIDDSRCDLSKLTRAHELQWLVNIYGIPGLFIQARSDWAFAENLSSDIQHRNKTLAQVEIQFTLRSREIVVSFA